MGLINSCIFDHFDVETFLALPLNCDTYPTPRHGNIRNIKIRLVKLFFEITLFSFDQGETALDLAKQKKSGWMVTQLEYLNLDEGR